MYTTNLAGPLAFPNPNAHHHRQLPYYPYTDPNALIRYHEPPPTALAITVPALPNFLPQAGHPNGSHQHPRISHPDHLHLATGRALGESIPSAYPPTQRPCGAPYQQTFELHNANTMDTSVDNPLVREQAAEAAALSTLSNDQPLGNVLDAFAEYRAASREVIFTNFALAKDREAHLWSAHSTAKNYFSKQLKAWRKEQQNGRQLSVQIRVMIDAYLKFVRRSVRFYREHVLKLHEIFGLPELKEVAHHMHHTEEAQDSLPLNVTPELRQMVLESCHRSIVYLGDLSRWRAQDNLDKHPEIASAVGYYSLAGTIRPQSGIGHHQLATIALRVPHHLRAIYHLYRSICVDEPHPLAKKHLETEFKMTHLAWTKNELIEKGPPNDPEARKKALVGWFVRLHSMCSTAETFRGYEELEREVMGQLTLEVKNRSLDPTLNRMVLVNIAAQHLSIERYQEKQSEQNEQAFYAFLRINLRTCTTLLGLFQADLLEVARNPEMAEADLTDKLLPITDRILPALRLYSSWLLLNTRLLFGLTDTPFLTGALKEFWKTYGRTLDLVATNFDVFDLEESAPVTYMLEEDAEILGFKPFDNGEAGLVQKLWYDNQTGAMKPRFDSPNVTRASPAEESLARVLGFLVDGLYVANDLEQSPIRIRGPRVFYGNGDELEQLIMPATLQKPAETPAPQQQQQPQPPQAVPGPPKPLSYAATAAIAAAKQLENQQQKEQKQKVPAQTKKPPKTNGAIPTMSSTQSHHSQDARMSRMVDDLVDDESDAANPATPRQHNLTTPAFNGDSAPRGPSAPNWRANAIPNGHPSTSKPNPRGHNKRLSATNNPWISPPTVTSPHFVPSNPIGTLGSPAPTRGPTHSRVNSANSARVSDSWASIDGAPQGTGSSMGAGVGASAVARNGVVTIPSISHARDEAVLFGAEGGIWHHGGVGMGASGRARWSFDASGPAHGGFGG